jgi:predicted TIM-barrel fold metal-dependent hydrolase
MWDAHAHVIGDPRQFPFWFGRSYTPEPAPLEAYLTMLDHYGIAHGVLVQPSVYGFDNRCLLDALERAGGRLFGIAVPPVDATTRDLEAMHGQGVRGVRCNLLNPGGLSPDVVIGWQPVMRALGWHVELHVSVDGEPKVTDLVSRFDVPVVIDHMGRPASDALDPESPRLRALVDLVRRDACFVKLSAPYRLSVTPAPWRDVVPLAQALVAANPRACLWGTDWPHVDVPPAIATADVVEALTAWCPEASPRQVITTAAARALCTRR